MKNPWIPFENFRNDPLYAAIPADTLLTAGSPLTRSSLTFGDLEALMASRDAAEGAANESTSAAVREQSTPRPPASAAMGHCAGVDTAPPKPAPDAVREALVLQFTPQELHVVQELAEYHQLSELQTMRQALRFYQLHDKRVRDGETVKWSGDDARTQEFAALSAPVPPADGARCSCGPMCQDLGRAGGCRYLQPSRTLLRKLVDDVWQHATESKAVPSTDVADRLIDDSFLSPSGTVAAEPWTKLRFLQVAFGEFKEHELRQLVEEISKQLGAAPPVRGDLEAISNEAIEEAVTTFANKNGSAILLTHNSGPDGITQATLLAMDFVRAILSLPVQPDVERKSLSEYTNAEISNERHRRAQAFLGDPHVGVTVPTRQAPHSSSEGGR